MHVAPSSFEVWVHAGEGIVLLSWGHRQHLTTSTPVQLIFNCGPAGRRLRMLTCPARCLTIVSSSSRSFGLVVKLAVGLPESLLTRSSGCRAREPRNGRLRRWAA